MVGHEIKTKEMKEISLRWAGNLHLPQPPILDRLEVVTDNGDVDTLGQATP